ncbi:hypothetical protein C8R47DRAFT_1069506 [Mycena vitilis]|nr:hypothetical protein C8R47DRAFT_1069506 [Mycena vitilis]
MLAGIQAAICVGHKASILSIAQIESRVWGQYLHKPVRNAGTGREGVKQREAEEGKVQSWKMSSQRDGAGNEVNVRSDGFAASSNASPSKGTRLILSQFFV